MRNIVLVGFMGTGKTTVGELLAQQTGMPLLDMDSLIVGKAGKSINDIFAQDGEPHFRSLERELVRELASSQGHVISTGGGIVLNPDNVTDFERSGLVVCLLASPETILNRVRHDTARPLLAGDKEAKIIELLERRKPLYEAVAHRIDTDGLRPEEIAEGIIRLYETNNS